MWMRWCALAMGLGLACVVAGLALAVHAQFLFLACDPAGPCDAAAARTRLAVEVSLLGVILTSLSTAAVAGLLMRMARPPVRVARPAPPPREGPSVQGAPVPAAPPR